MDLYSFIVSLSDSFIETAPWIAASLIIYQELENRKIFSFKNLSHGSVHQISISSMLGATPGCGGIMVVIKQFSNNHLSLGGLAAAMTATLGDAAFVLIAKHPLASIGLIGINVFAGILVGLWVQYCHSDSSYLGQKKLLIKKDAGLKRSMPKTYLYIWSFIIMGCMLGSLMSEANLHLYLDVIGLVGILLVFFMYVYRRFGPSYSCDQVSYPNFQTIVSETNFLMKWIIAGTAITLLPSLIFSVDFGCITAMHQDWLPLVTCLTGVIPGCGPQVAVATLYSQHTIPIAAQIGNSISTSGDAFFPIFAIAPHAAILFTFYGFVLAVLASYGIYLYT